MTAVPLGTSYPLSTGSDPPLPGSIGGPRLAKRRTDETRTGQTAPRGGAGPSRLSGAGAMNGRRATTLASTASVGTEAAVDQGQQAQGRRIELRPRRGRDSASVRSRGTGSIGTTAQTTTTQHGATASWSATANEIRSDERRRDRRLSARRRPRPHDSSNLTRRWVMATAADERASGRTYPTRWRTRRNANAPAVGPGPPRGPHADASLRGRLGRALANQDPQATMFRPSCRRR